MNRRNTRQKELIFKTLLEDKTHPTIQQIYQNVLKQDDKIGQATVYRNVGKLVEEGKVKRISIADEVDRYDADLCCHYHLFCEKCRNVFDLYDSSYQRFLEKLQRKYHIQIFDSTFVFIGLCNHCLKK